MALYTFHDHLNLRVIYTICEVPYRLIVPNRLNITSLTQLKGKRVGATSIRGTVSSSLYFVEKLLSSAGLKSTDYTIVDGLSCSTPPCENTTLPAMIARGDVDAIGMWEPTIEYGIRALGGKENVVIFQDKKVYREVFNLHSTAEKLADPKVRKEIVEFVKALRRSQAVFEREPERVYERVGKAVNMGVDVIKAIWAGHIWTGGLPGDILDVLVEEEKWVAGREKREAIGREKLATLIDGSVLREVEEADGL